MQLLNEQVYVSLLSVCIINFLFVFLDQVVIYCVGVVWGMFLGEVMIMFQVFIFFKVRSDVSGLQGNDNIFVFFFIKFYFGQYWVGFFKQVIDYFVLFQVISGMVSRCFDFCYLFFCFQYGFYFVVDWWFVCFFIMVMWFFL